MFSVLYFLTKTIYLLVLMSAADLRTDFISHTRHRHTERCTIWYDKNGKPRDHRTETIAQFLEADTVFTNIVDVDDDNIEKVWVGTTKLLRGTEMFFSAVLSDNNGYGGMNTSYLTVRISSSADVKSHPFQYISM